jgi:hypothetical protein
MKASIIKKIEEIKKKPEHIRKRYAVVCTAIAMFFVLIVWVVSIKVQNSASDKAILNQEQLDVLDELGQQKKSLEDTAGQIKDTVNQMPNPSEMPQNGNTEQKNPQASPEEGFNK